ncbi:MAG TPA: glycine betaine ABC transporter substrate-binding protein [Bryobacteraceae bacterium]|nr:glycine betaine ABC transporter substrate-binding protein [Bryobacteraceae bacterium]HOQ43793.1 glycine betaine ABC transporter substrate-binding protein [Bryobacteraceae bacterium]HPQ14079.1 glycine betaine ABC transporter substrate-binding protein [Bryobacteraceae bacterium]HPU71764.1 glycine betaine ABC transporter substrate-binding protein [Bryobacteraceae bacterium]
MDRRQAIAGLIGAGALASCGRGSAVRVGSKNFTEQVILGEIAAQLLEARLGTRVDRRLDLGGTMLAHTALVSGSLDTYPEYTGTALTAILQLPPARDPKAVFERVSREYQKRFEITWLPPLGFNDSFAMVVPGELARRYGLKTLSDAAAYRPGWKLGVGYEFLQRPDGLAALKATYGLPLAAPPITMDLGLLYRALEQGQVTMAAGNTTDGLLSVLDVVVLDDDKNAFPPYEAAFIARTAFLKSHPRAHDALASLSGKISESAMRDLNYSVDGRHMPPREVALRFLREARLV